MNREVVSSRRRLGHATSCDQSSLSLPQIIHQKNEEIRLLEREQAILKNDVAAALLTIAELRAQLATKRSALRSSRSTGHQLTLEAGKLKQEVTRINQRGQNALLETAQRLEVKNEAWKQLRADIDKVLKRNKLAQKEHRVLTDHLEQRDKVDVNMRLQYSLSSNWSVRQSAGKPESTEG